MRKLYIIFSLIVALIAVSCIKEKKDAPKIDVKSLIINSSSIYLVEGGTTDLSVKILPANATDTIVDWQSDNEDVASVNEKGNVVAQAIGTATISATVSNITVTCDVTVKASEILPVSIKIIPETYELYFERTEQLDYSILPKNVTNAKLKWASEDAAIVSVDQEGRITGNKIGTTNITATTVNGKVGTCAVTIVGKEVLEVNLKWSGMEQQVGDMDFEFIGSVLPADAVDKSLTWTSSDESIATVEWVEDANEEFGGKALITCVGVGKCNIIATAPSGAFDKMWMEISEETPISKRFAKTWKLKKIEFIDNGITYSEEDYKNYCLNDWGLSEEKANEYIELLKNYLKYEGSSDKIVATITGESGSTTIETTGIKQIREGSDIYNYESVFDVENAPSSIKKEFAKQTYRFHDDDYNWSTTVKTSINGVSITCWYACW